MTENSNLVVPMPIADLKPGRPAMVHGVVVHFEEVNERPSRDRMIPIRQVTLRDSTGEIRLTLWGDEVGWVRDADRVLLVEAWVSEYQGRPQLTLGSRGHLINLGPASGRGPLLKPDPREGLYVRGIVRRRLRERQLSKGKSAPSRAVPSSPEPSRPAAAPATILPLALAAFAEEGRLAP